MIPTYTDCPGCGRAVLAATPAAANEPARECYECWELSQPREGDQGRLPLVASPQHDQDDAA